MVGFWFSGHNAMRARMKKSLMFSLAILPTIVTGGCASPIVIDEGLFGVGLFRVQSVDLGKQSTYLEVEGIGFLATANRVTLGYSKHQRVVCAMDGRSFLIETPFGKLAGGAAATDAALELIRQSHKHMESPDDTIAPHCRQLPLRLDGTDRVQTQYAP